jgi:hypothetical protein
MQGTQGGNGTTNATSVSLDAYGNVALNQGLTVNGYTLLNSPPLMGYTSLPTFTTSMVGYVLTGTAQSTVGLSTTQITYQQISILPVGVWLLNAMITCKAVSSSNVVNAILRNSTAALTNGTASGVNSTVNNTSVQITTTVQNTTAQLYKLDVSMGAGTSTFVSAFLTATRIA